MEFVGRIVKKEFQGFGVFSGMIQSFNSSTGFFKIEYEDGDSEEMDLAEITKLLNEVIGESCSSSQLSQKPRVGRKPKKRRRVEAKPKDCTQSGNLSEISMSTDDHSCMKQCGVGEDSEDALPANGDMEHDFCGNETKLSFRVCAIDGANLTDGSISKYGSNSIFKLDEDDGNRSQCIDLNLDVKPDCNATMGADELGSVDMETRNREPLDLNFALADELKTEGTQCNEEVKEYTPDPANTLSQKESTATHQVECAPIGDLEGISLKNSKQSLKVGSDSHSLQEVARSTLSSADGTQKKDSILGKDVDGVVHFGVVGPDEAKESKCSEVPAIGNKSELHPVNEGVMGSSSKEEKSGRKRRNVTENLQCTEVVLRRSRRRGLASMLAENDASQKFQHCVNDCSPLSAVSELPDEKMVSVACEGPSEFTGLPPKVQLPPSSQNLNLDGLPVLDVFFIYACLRSFSNLLFLSPFKLEDFVAALKCEHPTSLFDSIHVCLLQILRKHLEFLSIEGSLFAMNCLRGLNWSLLDVVTWPSFLTSYLLFRPSKLSRGVDLNLLKLSGVDYYKQPASIKVDLLRGLCDDVIEVESVRLELDRRSGEVEPDLEFDRTVSREACKRKRTAMDISDGSKGVMNEMADQNSDECCLCKMDGSLICCDGCPAAYHSKCVGVVNDLLPDGEWYCPECVIERNMQIKAQMSVRGAELLGVDPHGRLYFSCCCYLLVSDSCVAESSFNYYQTCDMNVVIAALKSVGIHYSGILSAIFRHWSVSLSSVGDTSMKCQNTCLRTCPDKDGSVARIPEQISLATHESAHLELINAEPAHLLDCDGMTHVMDMDKLCTSSENLTKTIEEKICIQTNSGDGLDSINRSHRNPSLCEDPGNILCSQEGSFLSTDIDMKQDKYNKVILTSSARNPCKGDITPAIQSAANYTNSYSFAQRAASVAEELIPIASEKNNREWSVEDIISTQLKIILKRSTRFSWSSLVNVNVDAQKENCGWCFSCKNPDDDNECLFKMIKQSPNWEGPRSEVSDFQLKWDKKGHLVDVICQIISIGDRLHGLLGGPWLNPHHTKVWRQALLEAPDVKSVKPLLLNLESNLHRPALQEEWLKHVDSGNTMGSASHVVISISSKNGISRKRAKSSEFDSYPPSSSARGLGLYWWRGGRLSRRLFSWKVLPRSLASRAARKAGCTKIPGIVYAENSDFAKRSKYIAWQASLETSLTVEQLAVQVRDFDRNIKWDDIEGTHVLSVLDKGSVKSVRSFRKAVVRRKSTEGSVVKYLLDFGKRRFIPDVVSKFGSMLEEKSSERKKYWLDESYVPLHLLRSYEERRISRISTKLTSGKRHESGKVLKPVKKDVFSYLFLKAQRSENYACGHCKKDVPISEAVSCHYCSGSFHKKHVRKSSGLVSAECIYTCQKCRDVKPVKIDNRKRKVQSQKTKVASPDSSSVQLKKKNKRASITASLVNSGRNKKLPSCVPLRRSSRKIKYVSVVKNISGGSKKRKQPKTKKRTHRKPQKVTSWRKMRTHVCRTYWLNGLLLSEKPDDERVMHFKSKQLSMASKQVADIADQMECCLCHEAGDTSTLNLISCDFCGGWFHGDALGLSAENIDKLIKFKCHICLKRDPPVCPHTLIKKETAQSGEVENKCGTDLWGEIPTAILPQTEVRMDLFQMDEPEL